MSGLEAAALSLSMAIVKSAVKLWFRDNKVAADVSASAIDVISAKATTLFDKRHVKRTFEEVADTVGRKLTDYVQVELRGLPDNEKAAAIYAVADTFNSVPLSDNYLFSNDLNAAYIDRYLRAKAPQMAQRAFLSEAATRFYDIVLHESCEYVVQVTLALPQFQVGALTELLRRSTELISGLEELLSRLPRQTDGRDSHSFSIDYRRQVVNQLDRMELFGATLPESSRRYLLSVAYISLNLAPGQNSNKLSDSKHRTPADELDLTVEQALAENHRLFIRGEAGSGKTTLLKWIAVRSAYQDLPAQLDQWNRSIPFFIPLRRYVETELPSLHNFVDAVGRFISEEMPPGYVLDALRAGDATVLIDGLDEFPAGKREDARMWLNELISSFPDAKYVVTSRPGAVVPGWLVQEGFGEYEMLSMTPADIRAFIVHWHDAMRSVTSDADEHAELDKFEHRLTDRITSRRHLRALAETPLLCALLCALHRDRRGQLPNNRMELYEVALEMLLERRDAEHHVVSDTTLSRTEKTLLLQDIAYWLIRNGWSDAEKRQVVERIKAKLVYMSQISVRPDTVYRNLLERSGLIREPIAGRVDFVHRTFQEYLAALDALSANDIGLLVRNAHLDQWREVVVMAAGHAYALKRDELLAALVKRGDEDDEHRDEIYLLAVACLETSPELSVELRGQIRARVKHLLPPKNLTTAKSLASAGEFVVDLLAQSRPRLATEVAATIRAAAEIGTDSALRIIIDHRRDQRSTVVKQLLQAWTHFDTEEYAHQVLSHMQQRNTSLRIGSRDLLPGLRYLPHLRALDVTSRGTINLDFLEQLPELKQLAINSCPIESPEALSYCENLNFLNLVGTNIRDLSGIASLMKLRELHLSHTPVEDLSPLSGVQTLEKLHLYGANKLTDLRPLEPLANIRHLDLEGTGVTDLSSLSNLREMRHLDIRGLKVTDLSALANMIGLQKLYAQDTLAENLLFLTNLTQLETVNLMNTRIEDLGPLEHSRLVEHLDVSRTAVSSISPLAGLNNVRILNLSSTNVVDLSPISQLSKMRSLTIANTRISDLSPLRRLNLLANLYANNCPINDLTPLKDCPALSTLILIGTQVSDLSPLSGRILFQVEVGNTPIEDFTPLKNSHIAYLGVDSDKVQNIPSSFSGAIIKRVKRERLITETS